jgi:hypothetical protein
MFSPNVVRDAPVLDEMQSVCQLAPSAMQLKNEAARHAN